jgi:4-cresol dehydrogenase (hydroxylating) flavoprotein subunit
MHTQESNRFMLALSAVLGPGQVLNGADDKARYQANTSCFSKTIRAIALPDTVGEVRACVRLANEWKIPLYPISSGKNWGMGSRLPVRDDCVVLDLSGLNRIREIDSVMGYAVIEAGVTQEQLAKKLKEIDCPYFLDVTGSCATTTIIGNAMERGVAYNGLRGDQLLNLEVVLGNGKLLQTGFPQPEGAQLNHLYRYGIGPSVDQLFFQSNFGIVTAATIQLLRRCDSVVQFSLSLPDSAHVPDVLENLRTLRERHFLSSTLRVANKNRLFSVMGPLIQSELEKNDEKVSRAEVLSILGRYLRGEWFVGGTISGTGDFVRAAKKAVVKQLVPFGKIRFASPEGTRRLLGLAKFFRLRNLAALLTALRPLQDLAKGWPTRQTIPSTFWAAEADAPVDATLELDQSKVGLLFSAPICALKKEEIARLLKLTDAVCGRYGQNPAVTLNTATDRVIEGVISLHFNKSNASAVSQAQACLKELNRQYRSEGFSPYRLNIEEMAEVFSAERDCWDLNSKMKDLFDPNDIIAPGRYCPVVRKDKDTESAFTVSRAE